MTKRSEEEMIKIAESLDSAVTKAVSALVKAGVPEFLANSACVDAIGQKMALLNIENQDTKLARAAVFSLHAEKSMHLLLSRLFNVADVAGLANTDKDAMQVQTVVISVMLGHVIDGCLMTFETNEEARELFDNLVRVIWDVVRVKRAHADMEEESNAEGSSSIH